ncbi:MAG TPA: hypothetical protein VHX42_01325 [Candidatus Babeliales bacterium]|jgi:hypothetical protein|nr:hypothetical protein [Candidatus Babeliales bacterium]
MKKHIIMATISFCSAVWSMDHGKSSSKAINRSHIATTLHSFQTDADRKEGLKILDTINEKTGVIIPKTNPYTTTFSKSPLFVMHSSKL